MNTERRFLPIENRGIRLTQRADGDETEQLPDIEGTAAVFYDPNNTEQTQYLLWRDTYERIMPGAFDRAVKEDDVRALQNHDPRLLLGRNVSETLTLTVAAHGLDYRIVTPDTQTGRDTVTSLRRKDMTGSSFAFLSRKATWVEMTDDDGNELYIRQIEDVELFDVGPVTYPAYGGTSSGVRGSRSPALCGLRSSDAEREVEALRGELHDFLRENYYAPEADARARMLALMR